MGKIEGMLNLPAMEGMRYVAKRLVLTKLLSEMGVSRMWLKNRERGMSRFTEADALLANEHIHRIAERLKLVAIRKDEAVSGGTLADGATMGEQVKSLRRWVNMRYIYMERMEKSEDWLTDRIRTSGRVTKTTRFELEQINNYLSEMAWNLSMVNLYIE